MGPYRENALPAVDPRITKAIADGKERRLKGIENDKAQLKKWFEESFFKEIADKVEAGEDRWYLTAKSTSPFCYLRYMRDSKEVMKYVHEHFISQVKGLQSAFSFDESTNRWYVYVRIEN